MHRVALLGMGAVDDMSIFECVDWTDLVSLGVKGSWWYTEFD